MEGEVMDREWQKTNENDKIYGDNVGEIKKIHTLQHQYKIYGCNSSWDGRIMHDTICFKNVHLEKLDIFTAPLSKLKSFLLNRFFLEIVSHFEHTIF